MNSEHCLYCMNKLEGPVCGACGRDNGAYQAAPHHLQPGTLLHDKYRIGAVLGEGGFGITYIGMDINLGMRVAIKEYFPSGIVNRNNTCSTEISANMGDSQELFEKGKDRFLTEARVLAKFVSEPHIVSVFDFFSANNTAYIVMEFLEGTDLKTYLKQKGKMTFAEAYTMLCPIMQALERIHSEGLIHRDISPANIMVLRDGRIKLLDFGAAREVSGTGEKSLSILLKPGYAPEEQYRSKGHQGPWTDVYALSATMYKMMTGVTPDEAMNRVFNDELQGIALLNPAVTPEQEAVVRRGMAVHQPQRFQTMKELRLACQSVLVQNAPYRPTAAGSEVRAQGAKAASAAKDPQRTPSAPENRGQGPVTPPVSGRPLPAGNDTGQSKTDASQKGNKKPNIVGFILAVVFGVIALQSLFFATMFLASADAEENGGYIFFYVASAVITAGLSFVFGRLYFPRFDNKKRKPNVFGLVASIVCGVVTALLVLLVAFVDDMQIVYLVEALTPAALAVLAGHFYYPRLNRKKKRAFFTVYASIGAGIVALCVVGIVTVSLGTVTVDGKKFSRKETSVSIYASIIPDHELAKLKELKNLERLDITACFLDDEDVKTISEMTQLKKLNLSANTDITDVSPLNRLTSLEQLNLNTTHTKDIGCLDQLVNLKELNIGGTDVSDVSIVKSFTQLETLRMDSLENLDASTVVLPASLRTLNCSSDGITDLGFVADATELYNLNASDNGISDVSPLSALNQLSSLSLNANQVEDITPLPTGVLETLEMTDNCISDIGCLAESMNLRYLMLGHNQISDITALTDHSKLFQLELAYNRITDISALHECFKIYTLDISHNQITDISVISWINDLTYFEAEHNCIEDISVLSQCTKLKETSYLNLSHNKIQNVESLRDFQCKTMDLSDNAITDVSPLTSCEKLETLFLNRNRITDISPLSDMPVLNIMEIVGNPIAKLDRISLHYEDSPFGFSLLKLSYSSAVDWEALSKIEHLAVWVYDATPREQADLSAIGYRTFVSSDDLLGEEEQEEAVPEQAPEETVAPRQETPTEG